MDLKGYNEPVPTDMDLPDIKSISHDFETHVRVSDTNGQGSQHNR